MLMMRPAAHLHVGGRGLLMRSNAVAAVSPSQWMVMGTRSWGSALQQASLKFRYAWGRRALPSLNKGTGNGSIYRKVEPLYLGDMSRVSSAYSPPLSFRITTDRLEWEAWRWPACCCKARITLHDPILIHVDIETTVGLFLDQHTVRKRRKKCKCSTNKQLS